MHDLVREVQEGICRALVAATGEPYHEEHWERPGGGGGRSRLWQDGEALEKAGVNTSAVHGTLSESAWRAMRASHAGLPEAREFYACGISLVLHPRNPFAPTVHANYRLFELGDGESPGSWWYGGGADLTPAYLFEEDARQFHVVHRAACDRHDPSYYPRFKDWCDRYFHLPHRGETRGVGGIFFDDLAGPAPRGDLFAFVEDCARSFVPAWLPLFERRLHTPYEPAHREWQLLRRGRYVEFNLLYDRGTVFGLKTGARVDSVLMSLPLTARWEAGHAPSPGSREEALLEVLRHPRAWAGPAEG